MAPWNGTYPIRPLSFRSIAAPLGQNLYHRSDPVPLGFTTWNTTFPVKQPSLGILAIRSGRSILNWCLSARNLSKLRFRANTYVVLEPTLCLIFCACSTWLVASIGKSSVAPCLLCSSIAEKSTRKKIPK